MVLCHKCFVCILVCCNNPCQAGDSCRAFDGDEGCNEKEDGHGEGHGGGHGCHDEGHGDGAEQGLVAEVDYSDAGSAQS